MPPLLDRYGTAIRDHHAGIIMAATDKKHDKAVDMSFLPSDPVAHGKATATEPPAWPSDRKDFKFT
jgi:hypothetical protein